MLRHFLPSVAVKNNALHRLSAAGSGLAAFYLLSGVLGATAYASPQSFTIDGTSTNVKAELTITSLSASQVVFSFANISPNTIGSKLTGIGFDIAGAANYALSAPSPNNTPYEFFRNEKSVPQYGSAVLDFGVALGGDFTGGGNPNPGLSVGQSSGSYTVTSSNSGFASLTATDIADSVFFRFKAITDNPQTSDVAHGVASSVAVTSVPEPSAIAFSSIVGTIIVGLLVRKRRNTSS